MKIYKAAAPGIGIYGPLPRIGNIYPATEAERRETARYDYQNGSSMAAAITSGVAAMLMEWGYGVIIRLLNKGDINITWKEG